MMSRIKDFQLFLVAATAWLLCVAASSAATQESQPEHKIQLQFKGRVGDVYRQELTTSSATQEWMPESNQFVEVERETSDLTTDTRIEAVQRDGWMLELDSTVRFRYKKANEASVVDFDSENQEDMDTLRAYPEQTNVVNRITTPVKVLQSPAGDFHAVDDLRDSRVEQLMTQRRIRLPRTPVALHARWPTGNTVNNFTGMGQITSTGTATIQDLRMEGGELVAEIVEIGTRAAFKADEEWTGRVTMREYTQKSTTILAVARGRVKRSEVEISFFMVNPEQSDRRLKFSTRVVLTEVK